MKNLITRTLTGAIYVALLVGCTIYSPVTSWIFFAIVATATTAEFATIVNKHGGASVNRKMAAFASLWLVTAVWLQCLSSELCFRTYAIYGIIMLYILISELYRKAGSPLLNWAYAFASQLYIALPFALLPMLGMSHDPETGLPSYQWIYPLSLFIFLWTNDTGAYLTGCTLSRYVPYKLFPRISPKKSWIGSIGGGLLTIAASLVINHYFPETLGLEKWMGFALTVVVFGTWGDLTESLIKRYFGIKDSGNVLPGHGGLLDRFDSALLSIPAVIIYLLLNSSL